MQTTQLHEDKFLKISWEEKARIIGIDWGARIPPMRSSPEEKFLTETFDDVQKAEAWLTAG